MEARSWRDTLLRSGVPTSCAASWRATQSPLMNAKAIVVLLVVLAGFAGFMLLRSGTDTDPTLPQTGPAAQGAAAQPAAGSADLASASLPAASAPAAATK